MEDSQIIDLYWARLEQAIQETDTKYGGYCRAIAHNILKSVEDSEECVSDTWLRAWNAMPPQRPSVLSAFLGRITRNLSLDRYKAARAEKRGGSSFPAALDELSECVPAGGSVVHFAGAHQDDVGAGAPHFPGRLVHLLPDGGNVLRNRHSESLPFPY